MPSKGIVIVFETPLTMPIEEVQNVQNQITALGKSEQFEVLNPFTPYEEFLKDKGQS